MVFMMFPFLGYVSKIEISCPGKKCLTINNCSRIYMCVIINKYNINMGCYIILNDWFEFINALAEF